MIRRGLFGAIATAVRCFGLAGAGAGASTTSQGYTSGRLYGGLAAVGDDVLAQLDADLVPVPAA